MTQTELTLRSRLATARFGSTSAPPRRVGQWELVGPAAEGSLCGVYRARPVDGSADRPAAYAMKMLLPRWEDDPGAIRLLLREVVAGRSVSHPHLVSVLSASISRPPRFLVMPWLEGWTLQEHLSAERCFDLPEVLWIGRQVAEALQALHAAGWTHGDVKPSNVFLSPQYHVTLLDLGFARRSDESGSAVDRCVTGTCNYMAPELIVSALRADIRSDIYSLGVVLFQMFSGRLPFSGDDLAALATQHKQAAVPDLYRLAPQLPVGVVRLVREMLSKEPLRRPQTPGELIERLTKLEIATFSERAL